MSKFKFSYKLTHKLFSHSLISSLIAINQLFCAIKRSRSGEIISKKFFNHSIRTYKLSLKRKKKKKTYQEIF